MESFGRLRLSGYGGIFRVYEIINANDDTRHGYFHPISQRRKNSRKPK